MTMFETLAVKGLSPLVRFAPPLGRYLHRKLIADHAAICGAGPHRSMGIRFSITVSVAPARSARPLAPHDFVDRARELAEGLLQHLPHKLDYSGSSQVRYVVYEPGKDSSAPPLHIVRIFPTGLVELQWGLQSITDPADGRVVAISLDEMVRACARLYAATRRPMYARIWKARRTEVVRKRDWRLGVTPSASSDAYGTLWWSRLLIDGSPVPGRNLEQVPSCPVDGFAPTLLRSKGSRVDPVKLFRAPFQHLLVDAGFTDAWKALSQCLTASAFVNAIDDDDEVLGNKIMLRDKPELP